MLYPIYYITAKNTALKRFTGITGQDIYILGILYRTGGICHYKRLHDLLHENGYGINYKVLTAILRRDIDKGYITRSAVAGNVLYEITMEGNRLLKAFALELDSIVEQQVLKYGNGFNVD